MPSFICATCGTQFPDAESPPQRCPICEDERQYVGHGGQLWTTPDALRAEHRNRIEALEPGLVGIGTEPTFAIGQRALLVQTPEGNILWDCVSLLDDATVEAVEELGGLHAIAISHPHYYSSMADWGRAFGVPVYLHAADRQHVVHPDPSIRYWDEETLELLPGVTLIRGGGHFAGGTVLHWAAGVEGRGTLLTGDIIQVVSDRRFVSFMYSYPNLIPLSAAEVRRIAAAVEPFEFERIYGAWWETVVRHDAKRAVRSSAERYIRALGENTRDGLMT